MIYNHLFLFFLLDILLSFFLVHISNLILELEFIDDSESNSELDLFDLLELDLFDLLEFDSELESSS